MPLHAITGQREANLRAIVALSPSARRVLGPDWLDLCVSEGLHPLNNATDFMRLNVLCAELADSIVEGFAPLAKKLQKTWER